MNPVLKAPGTKRLKLTYENQLSSLAFNFNLRRYTKAAFDAYIGDAATETWPVEDLLPLSLRATFLSASSGRKKMLLKWRRYAFPAAAFDLLVDRGGGRAPLTENAFTMFQRHVKSFAGCAARRVKVDLLSTPSLISQ